MTSPTSPPEGWYPDPHGKPVLRRWTGDTWADETREMPPPGPAATATVASVPVAAASPAPTRTVTPEHEVLTARVHLLSLCAPALVLSTVFLLLTFVFFAGSAFRGGLIFFAVANLLLSPVYISSVVQSRTTTYSITTQRVTRAGGVLSRHSSETLLGKIESVQVTQDLLERRLGSGTVLIGGTGGHKEPLRNIQDPEKFRRTLQAQIEAVLPEA